MTLNELLNRKSKPMYSVDEGNTILNEVFAQRGVPEDTPYITEDGEMHDGYGYHERAAMTLLGLKIQAQGWADNAYENKFGPYEIFDLCDDRF